MPSNLFLAFTRTLRYVGQAISEIDKGIGGGTQRRTRPVIGIASYGILASRNLMMSGGRHNGIENVTVEDSKDGKSAVNVGLDCNHNVFFLFDDGAFEPPPPPDRSPLYV